MRFISNWGNIFVEATDEICNMVDNIIPLIYPMNFIAYLKKPFLCHNGLETT